MASCLQNFRSRYFPFFTQNLLKYLLHLILWLPLSNGFLPTEFSIKIYSPFSNFHIKFAEISFTPYIWLPLSNGFLPTEFSIKIFSPFSNFHTKFAKISFTPYFVTPSLKWLLAYRIFDQDIFPIFQLPHAYHISDLSSIALKTSNEIS